MLSLLIRSSSQAEWWDFSMSEYQARLSESVKRPIFALMYATWCPMCHSCPQKFRDFYEREKDKTNVTFTLIECTDILWCRMQGARSIPYWVVIRGKNPSAWEFTNERNPSAWKKLLQGADQSPVVRIDTNHFESRILGTIQGYSYFHLVIQEDHKDVLKQFQSLAEKYMSYGCKFTYKVKAITKPSLRVYRSPFCMYKIKGNLFDFEWFVSTNKFSHFHSFTESDINEVNNTTPFALYVLETSIQQSQFNNFANLSEQYCKQINFGYTVAFEEKLYQNKSDLSKDDIPFILITSPKHNCSIGYKKRLLDGKRLGLYDHIIKGGKCDTFREGWVQKRNPEKMMFFTLGFFGTTAFIGLFFELKRLLISVKFE